MVIAEAIRSRFDCIDPVVDSFHEISAKGPARVGQNARRVSSQPTCERAQRSDPAARGALVPVLSEPLGVVRVPVVPQSLEVVFEDAECHQRLVC